MKKRYLYIIPIIVILALVLTIIITPSYYLRVSNLYMGWKAGLTKKTDDTLSLSYYENESDNPTLVLLYPQGDSKEGFLHLAEFLSDKYHLIIPDIPYASSNDNEKYNSILEIVQHFDKLLDNKNITQSSWFGAGIGAHFASAYALYQPKKVRDLILLGNEGLNKIKIPKENLLTEESFEKVMKKYFSSPPDISSFSKDYYINTINKSLQLVDTWKETKKKDILFQHLQDSLVMIEVPTLVLWPDKGQEVVDYTISKKVFRSIPVSKFVTLKDTSLLAYREHPIELSKVIDTFIKEEKANYLHTNIEKHKIETQIYSWLSYFGKAPKKQSLKNHLNAISAFIECRPTGGLYGGTRPYVEKMMPIIAKEPQRYEVISKSITPSVLGHYAVDLTVKKQRISTARLSNLYHEEMKMEIKYENGYYLPKINKLNIRYSEVLPIDSVGLKKGSNTHFHRMKSVVYFWMFLTQRSFKKKDLFAKVLNEPFEISMGLPLKDIGMAQITTLDQLIDYYSQVEKQLKIANQHLLNLKMTKLKNDKYEIDAKIAWRGIYVKDNELGYQTLNVKFIVTDDLRKEFPIIKNVKMIPLDASRILL